MNAALLDILNGWGDLSPEDLKRLELYRPERLATALAVIELPKSKSSEAKARLSQMRQYAADLEQRALDAKVAAVPGVQTPPQAALPQFARNAREVAPTPAVISPPAIVPLPPALVAPAYLAMPKPPVAEDLMTMSGKVGTIDDDAPTMGVSTAGSARLTGIPLESTIASLAAAMAIGNPPSPDSRPNTELSSGSGSDVVPVPVADPTAASGSSGLDDVASFWADPRSPWEPKKEDLVRGIAGPDVSRGRGRA